MVFIVQYGIIFNRWQYAYTKVGLDPVAYFLSFARLAPVQMVWWGHPDTSGVPSLDYFVSSDVEVSEWVGGWETCCSGDSTHPALPACLSACLPACLPAYFPFFIAAVSLFCLFPT